MKAPCSYRYKTTRPIEACIDYTPEIRRRIRVASRGLYITPAITCAALVAFMVGVTIGLYFLISGW